MSNPFKPTVIINGSILYSDPSTLPSNYANTNVYINLNSSGAISGEDICDVFSMSFSLDYTGGKWEVITGSKWANIGTVTTFMGLPAFVMDEGPIQSNSAVGRVTSGNFGGDTINKQLNNVFTSVVQLNQLLLRSVSGIRTANSIAQPVSAVAKALAAAMGVGLSWNANDTVMTQINFAGSSTVGASLQQLASLVNATLRWNGIDSYEVIDPNVPSNGTWTLPDCQLLASGGFRGQNHFNINTGGTQWINQSANVSPSYSNNSTGGASFAPPNNTPDAGTVINNETSSILYPSGSVSNKPVQKLESLGSRVLTTNDPPVAIDLPPDYDQTYIQIVVPDEFNTGDQNVVPASLQATAWMPAPFGGTYQQVNKGGAYITQLLIDDGVFPPSNQAVKNGNCTTNIGITRKSLKTLYQDGGGSVPVLPRVFPVWFKNFSASISVLFYGVIPLPGMLASVTADGVTITGIIESVSFSPPGILTLQIAQYVGINYSYPYNLSPNVPSI